MHRISRLFTLGSVGIVLLAMAMPVPGGVTVGSSTLIGTLDYSDTFTFTEFGGIEGRPGGGFPVGFPGINVEDNHGNPPRAWSDVKWSLNTDADAFTGYPGGSGAGSDTGFTQTGGGGDWGIEYGLREQFVVQVDAVQTTDRIDITIGGARDTIAPPNGLAVFFRPPGTPYAEIGLYNGAAEVDTGLTSGVPGAAQWHNYAVSYDLPNRTLEFFVDEVSRGAIDIDTVGGGAFNGMSVSNGAVSVGFAGSGRTDVGQPGHFNIGWTDNFQVGGTGVALEPHPDPGNIPNLPAGLVSYWDFNEAAGEVPGFLLDFAYDRQGSNDGSFTGTATRVAGLIGLGAAGLDNAGLAGIGVGADFSATTGVTIEALIQPGWTGTWLDYDQIFRKEDGGNRILFSFQNDPNNPGADPPVADGPVLSFGLNTGGYQELDMPLDGLEERPTLEDLTDGAFHHVLAIYDAETGKKAIWIDGVETFSTTYAPGTGIVSGGGGPAYIGNTVGLGESFTGVIDEVAFWDRALSADEIATHYANVQAGNFYFIPEPSTLVMVLTGLAVLLVSVRRRRR